MRTLDTQYIENLLENLIGKRAIQIMIEQSGKPAKKKDFAVAYALDGTVAAMLMPKIAEMTAEKLGTIIQYSDKDFVLGHERPVSLRVRKCSPLFGYVWEGEYAQSVLRSGGKRLLEYQALATLLKILEEILVLAQLNQIDDIMRKMSTAPSVD